MEYQEIIEHFKNAKVVECIDDKQHFDITMDGEFDTIETFENNETWLYFNLDDYQGGEGDKSSSRYVKLFDEGKLATIIEYKDNPQYEIY